MQVCQSANSLSSITTVNITEHQQQDSCVQYESEDKGQHHSNAYFYSTAISICNHTINYKDKSNAIAVLQCTLLLRVDDVGIIEGADVMGGKVVIILADLCPVAISPSNSARATI